MEITDFQGLLLAAQAQAVPQRLLFVFLKTLMQKDYTPEQRAGFEAGEGGALLPRFCVDLGPNDITDFAALVREADQQEGDWDKVLVACIDAPSSGPGAKAQLDHALETMVARVQTGGSLTGFLCFSRDGTPIVFE